MTILLLGATGFLGRALVLRLLRDGHHVVCWVRDPARARPRLGAAVELVEAASGDVGLAGALARADAVINLAGEPIVGGRLTDARRQLLRDSRVGLTERLVAALAAAPRRPRTLIAGSAVGLYGDRGDHELTEASAPGTGFLAELCRDWEAAAERAADLGVRVVRLRTGVVLGRGGGALARLEPVFRAGLGGPIAGGRQVMAWIHLTDWVELVMAALGDERYRGPINATAPAPVDNRGFGRTLAGALGRRAIVPVPGLALRVALGGAAEALLASQRAVPARALALGFRFGFPTLDGALADLTSDAGVAIERLGPGSPAPALPGDPYLRRGPTYLLRARSRVAEPLDRVLPFFEQPANLGLLTPPALALDPVGALPPMAVGAEIRYRLRLGPLPLGWTTRIAAYRPGFFIDSQEAGPYRAWWHEHHFCGDGDHTVIEDRVYYAPPLGVLGRLVHPLVVAPRLRQIFGFRAEAIGLRFASTSTAARRAA